MSSPIGVRPQVAASTWRRRASEFVLRLITVAIVALGSLQLGLDAWSFVLVYGIQLGLALVLVAPWLYALDEVVRPSAASVVTVVVLLAIVWLLLVALPLLWSFSPLQDASLREAVRSLPDQLAVLTPLIGLLLLADLIYLALRTLECRPVASIASEEVHAIPAHLTDRLLHRALVHAFFVLFGPLMLKGLISGGWSETLAIVVVYVSLEGYLLVRNLRP